MSKSKIPSCAPPSPPDDACVAQRDARQARGMKWAEDCFGAELARVPQERASRFFEEAIELSQAAGLDKSSAMRLVEYVYGRPVGDPAQEAGGTQVALLILCEHLGISAGAEEHREFERVLSLAPEHMRKRQEYKASMGVASSCSPAGLKSGGEA